MTFRAYGVSKKKLSFRLLTQYLTPDGSPYQEIPHAVRFGESIASLRNGLASRTNSNNLLGKLDNRCFNDLRLNRIIDGSMEITIS